MTSKLRRWLAADLLGRYSSPPPEAQIRNPFRAAGFQILSY